MSLHSFTGVFLCNENSTFPMYGTVAFQPRFLNVYCVIFAALRILQILPALVMPTGSAARRPDLFLRHRVVPSENLIYCPAVLPRISVNSSANIAFIFESGLEFHPQIESVPGTDERALIHRLDISKTFCIFVTVPRQNSIGINYHIKKVPVDACQYWRPFLGKGWKRVGQRKCI